MFYSKCGNEKESDDMYCGSCGEKVDMSESTIAEEGKSRQKHKQKNTNKKVFVLALVFVLLITIFVGAKGMVSKSDENTYIYLSGVQVEMTSNLNKEDSVKIGASKPKTVDVGMVKFSQDEKYVYYYTRYDSQKEYGTLCRAEYGKLEVDSSKNEEFIETIDTCVSLGFELLSDGSVVYKKDDNSLHWYNGKQNVQIAESIDDFKTDGVSRIIYTVYDRSSWRDVLYGVSITKLDEPKQLTAGVKEIVKIDDFDNILVESRDDDNNNSLYLVGFDKEIQKIGDKTQIVATMGDKIYFISDEDAGLTLYDFVEDDIYAEADEACEYPDSEKLSASEYEAAWIEYIEVRERKRIRYDLQGEACHVYTLYCFENGILTEIKDDVLNVENHGGAIVFNAVDMIGERLKFEDVSDVTEVSELFQYKPEAENYVVTTNNGTMCHMSSEAAQLFAKIEEASAATLYSSGKEVYLDEGDGAVYISAIVNGVIRTFEVLAENAKVLKVVDDTLYYTDSSEVKGDDAYININSYKNGKTKHVASDVLYDDVNIYADEVICAYTGKERDCYELSMFDKNGNVKMIGDEVTQYIRIDKSTVAYISDGDLYVYSGKEKKLVRDDVDWLWCLNAMEVQYTLDYYDYRDYTYDYFDTWDTQF